MVTEDPPPKSSFPFLKLPAELQSMVISHLVVEDGLIPLQSRRWTDQSIHNGYHVKSCCGHCRGFSIENDDECRCINSGSYSTSCRCVSYFVAISFICKNIRKEALRLYWSYNTFCFQITPVPTEYFKQRRLIIDTLSCLGGIYNSGPINGMSQFLGPVL